MKYIQYANDVINGKIIACKYIKQAAHRFLSFIDKYDFRTEKIDRVINFISKLKHSTGEHNKKNFILQPYQVFIIASIFGFYHKGTNKRVCRYAYLELARKSGKTALAAAICLYMLIADGENGSEVELIANSAKQAKICFTMCSNYLQSIDTKGKYFKRYRDNIKFDKTKSLLQVLSSDADGNDGYNSYCFVLDEAHAMKDSALWDVMVSSQGMRQNSLGIIITTAGFNKYGFCYQYRQSCIEILNGNKENDAQFCAIFTLDADDDFRDNKCWIKANPSLGITVKEDYLQQQVLNATNNTSLEVGVRTKNFNQWISTFDIWLDNDLLLECSKKLDLKDFINCYNCYVGIDLAAVSDLTAVSYMFIIDDKYYFFTKYYLPSTCLENNSNSDIYKEWKRKGLLTITDGNVTDYDIVLSDILRINNQIGITKISYDSYNATQFCINATSEGLPMIPFSQALWNFNKPTKYFEILIKSGKIILDDNEITRWCFSNVYLKTDHNENVKPVKTTQQQKIDGVISILEALGGFLEEPQYNNEITII